ncbi:MAG: DEAD/DEAH box helicase [Candidatus Aenigmatarchaeota archaeon]
MNITKQNNFYTISNINIDDVIVTAEENQNIKFDYFKNAIDILDDNKIKIHQFFIFELYILLKYARMYDDAIHLYNNTHLKNIGYGTNNLVRKNVSDIIKYEPKPYQEIFIKNYPILKNKLDLRGYYLAFDTGLGKTFTSFYTSFAYGDRLIVVSPKSLKINWKSEILMFSNFTEDDICIFPEENYTNQKVLLTNYEQIKNIPHVFDKNTFIVLDEAQIVRYADRVKIINLYNFVKANNIDNILILSGTPVKGRYGELSGAFLLLDKYFDEDAISYFYKAYNKASAIGSLLLKHRLSLTMLRLTKEKVGKVINLPPKNIVIEPVHLSNIEDYLITKDKVLKFILECSQINNEFIEKTKHVLPDDLYKRLQNRSITVDDLKILKKIREKVGIDFIIRNNSCIAKSLVNFYINTLRKMIIDIYKNKLNWFKKLFKQEKKILVFTMYVDIAEELVKLFKEHITDNVFIIHGQTPLDERAKAIKKFKEEDTILVATYGALGYGVTLVEGRIVVYADLPYREADLKQAVDRVYRIGQTREVYVYYLKLAGENTLQDKREKIIEKYAQNVKELIDTDFEYILEQEFEKVNI